MLTLEVVFWASCALVGYTYVGYPLVLQVLSRFLNNGHVLASSLDQPTSQNQSTQLQLNPIPSRLPAAESWPHVTLIIAAYKEQSMILQRIENALRMDYPIDCLEILIGVDGQEDLTGELVKTVDDPRVKLCQFPVRRGKPSVLNDCAEMANGTILAFSDANTFWGPDALKLLVRHFADPQVGGVCGQLILTDAATGKNSDGLYWKYENRLKRQEGQIGALLGFNGAIYAVTRSLWKPIPAQTIVDDFLIGMRIHRTGQKVIFEELAVANEETAPSIQAEFQRRTRIGAGGFQSLVWLADLLSPAYGRLALAFWSHKVLRWICPGLMLAAFISNAVMAISGNRFYSALLLVQSLFYVFAIAGKSLPGQGLVPKLVRLCGMFVDMNVALAIGFWRWASKRQKGTWTRTERSQEQAAAIQNPESVGSAPKN